MGKSRQKQNREFTSRRSSSSSTNSESSNVLPEGAAPTEQVSYGKRLLEWCYAEREGLSWVLGCALMGSLLGFGIGTGHLTGGLGQQISWRNTLGAKIRGTPSFKIMTFQTMPWRPVLESLSVFPWQTGTKYRLEDWRINPSHPHLFNVLREAVIRESGGFVHPDLGLLTPAPCGAARGLGMVRSSYTDCQTRCMPGIASEKLKEFNSSHHTTSDKERVSCKQEEVLLRIPLGVQLTRQVAFDVLLPLVPQEVQRRAPLEELDDAALLVMLLAHERGLGKASRYLPYIISLPIEPTCGYSFSMRPYMLDSISMMGEQLRLDVNGWAAELAKATQYADRIAGGLARDYGSYIRSPDSMTAFTNIQWALCQVASRAIAGSDKHGSLRLVPVVDMINHDANAGGFVELKGQEQLESGDFIDATEEDSGTFVVRSIRHGRRKPLKEGQEVLVNYNVPGYSPLDWFVSSGFVPPERWGRWTKIDAALPRVRKDATVVEGSMSAGRRNSGSQHHVSPQGNSEL